MSAILFRHQGGDWVRLAIAVLEFAGIVRIFLTHQLGNVTIVLKIKLSNPFYRIVTSAIDVKLLSGEYCHKTLSLMKSLY